MVFLLNEQKNCSRINRRSKTVHVTKTNLGSILINNKERRKKGENSGVCKIPSGEADSNPLPVPITL